MTKRITPCGRLVALSCLAAVGCTAPSVPDRNSGDNGGSEGVAAPICPGCQDLAGGESSDFGGDEGPCAIFYEREAIALEQAAELGFDTAVLDAATAQPIVSSFAWHPFTDFIPGERQWAPGQDPSGYQPETSNTMHVELTGTASHAFYDPGRCDNAGNCYDMISGTNALCVSEDSRGWLLVEAEIHMKLADGSIETTTPVVLTSFHSGFKAGLRADLLEVTGTLQIGTESAGPYMGALYGELYFGPGYTRGVVYPQLEPAESGGENEWFHRPLVGRFPAEDDCEVDEIPADPETDAGQAIIDRVSELYPALRLPAEAASPMRVRWIGPPPQNESNGGEETSFHMALGSEPRPQCASPDGVLTFATEVQMSTDDGKLSWMADLLGAIREPREDEPAELHLTGRHYFNANNTFWNSSAPAIDLLGSTVGRVIVTASFVNRQAGMHSEAHLRISTVPSCELDPRCTGEEQDCRSCGRLLGVAGFDSMPEGPTAPVDVPDSP